MKDRQPTQVLANGAIRYGIYHADGTLDHYEYIRREDAPTVEGTPLSKANLLSDATASKLWPGSNKPEDPTVNQAFEKLSKGMHLVGDIELTSREAPSSAWLPCDGRFITQAQYPELYPILRAAATSDNWTAQVVATTAGDSSDADDIISYANGYWFRSRIKDDWTVELYRSSNGTTWAKCSVPSTVHQIGPIHYYNSKYVCLCTYGSNYDVRLLTANNPANSWSVMSESGEGIGDHTYIVDFDVLYDGASYYVYTDKYSNYAHVYHSSNPATGWTDERLYSGTSPIQDAIYDADSGYFFFFNGSTLYRCRTLYDQTTWETMTSVGVNGGGSIAVYENTIVAAVTGKLLYSLNAGTSFTTKTGIQYLAGNLIAFDGFFAGASGTSIQISDDIAAGFISVDVGYEVTSLAGNGNFLIGSCKSTATVMRNVYHDYTYDSKRIPNITPDVRSHAYIKAVEE